MHGSSNVFTWITFVNRTSVSGFLPVNTHAEDNILNLNCINSFILYSSTNRLSNGIH